MLDEQTTDKRLADEVRGRDDVVPQYPRILVGAFTGSIFILVGTLLGLFAAPLLMPGVVTALLFGLAFALGGLALTVGHAERIREQL